MALQSTPAQRLAVSVSARRRWIVLAMLLALHVALASTPGGQFQRSWLLVHFGLFLLWQPFIAAEREIELFSGVLLFVITAVTIYFLAGWMIVAWLLIVLGILGGRVFTVQGDRRNRFYLVAFAYVLAILLMRAVPVLMLGVEVPEPLPQLALIGLPVMLLALAFLPMASPQDDSRQVFDFFYAVLVFQLGLVLVLGSIAFMRVTDEHYFTSVALTVMGFGIALFVLATLWNPVRGFGGLRTYFSRYLLSVGMPFEMWMRRIAELAESEPDAQRFLEQAFAEIAALPWMRGAHWKSPDGDGGRGFEQGYATRFIYHELEVVFHTEISLSPALFLHMRLLAQVVGEFYEGKRRESALRRNAYLQAVHETGARLTHDVKNLLQSLYTLTSMAPQPGADDGYGQLLRRQLPELSQRLRGTLDKLRAPEVATRELTVGVRDWWQSLETRLEPSGVALHAVIEGDAQVPGALLDSFVENAVDNARAKAAREPGIGLSVTLACDASGVRVDVRDSGSAVPPAIARSLFREPVERDGGLGIGLYNAARHAQQAGYEVALTENEGNGVCFTLKTAPPSPGQR
jgi:signal transduction histidine kinase